MVTWQSLDATQALVGMELSIAKSSEMVCRKIFSLEVMICLPLIERADKMSREDQLLARFGPFTSGRFEAMLGNDSGARGELVKYHGG